MRNSISLAAILLVALAIGCKNDQTANNTSPSSSQSAMSQASMTPEQLGALGAAIKKSPNDAQRLLSDHGLTEESFEQAIRKVSEDPAQSKRYADAYHKAGA